MSDSPFALEHSTDTVAIVGVGLIGGSIGAALRKRGFGGRVLGVGRDEARLERARAAGLIDEALTDLVAAASRSDLIVVCTPVDCIVSHVREAATSCRPGTLITDAGSVKRSICRALDGMLASGVTFIGSHPLAGSEKQGFEHARADLFQGRICVVTPAPKAPADQLARLTAFWESIGFRVRSLSPEEHDCGLARTSHLPHVAAASLASLLSNDDRLLAATGFRDTTRIAAGDPGLWVPILLNNAEPLLQELDRFGARLAEFRQAISTGDGGRLRELLAQAKQARESLDGERAGSAASQKS